MGQTIPFVIVLLGLFRDFLQRLGKEKATVFSLVRVQIEKGPGRIVFAPTRSGSEMGKRKIGGKRKKWQANRIEGTGVCDSQFICCLYLDMLI